MNFPMSSEGRSVQLSGDDDTFPFYSLDTGKRKYQQRRLKPQTEMLEKDAISSSNGDKLSRPSGRRKKRFVGVRQRSSGRWVAEIKDTTQKIRLWLGTFDTAEDAARAYDEAACMLRGMNTRTNFMPSPASANASVLPSKAARALHQRLKNTSVVKHSKSWQEMNPSIPSSLSGLSSSLAGKGDYNTQPLGFGGYSDHDEEAAYKFSSITSMLSSPSFKGIHDILQNDRPLNFHTDDHFAGFEAFSANMEYQQQNHQSFSATPLEFKSQEREDSPDSSADLSETLSDLVNSGESSMSLFDFSVDIPMPSCSFEEISGMGDLTNLAEIQGAPSASPDTEQIRRFHFERVSSASLYAMNGVQELLMRSGEVSSNKSSASASSFGRSPSFRGVKSSLLPCSKMLKSPGWILSSPQPGNSPAAHKSGEYQSTGSDASWTAHLCRVA